MTTRPGFALEKRIEHPHVVEPGATGVFDRDALPPREALKGANGIRAASVEVAAIIRRLTFGEQTRRMLRDVLRLQEATACRAGNRSSIAHPKNCASARVVSSGISEYAPLQMALT